MRRMILCSLAVLFLFLIGCHHRTLGEDDHLNIFFSDTYTREIQGAYQKAREADPSIPKAYFVTPYEDVSNRDALYDTLLKTLVSKSPDIDLFFVDSVYTKIASDIIEKHYYEDLTQDETLMSYFDDMYPAIRGYCTHGDEVFGFPCYVYYYMNIMADESKIRSIGYTLDDIGTLDGFLEFCDAWDGQKANPATGGKYQDVLEYCKNYMLLHYDHTTGELNLDTPEFRSILSQCRELNQTDYFQGPHMIVSDLFSDASPLYFGTVFILSKEQSRYAPIPFPRIEGEPPVTKRYADVVWLVINPYGEHKDQALKVVEAFAARSGDMSIFTNPLYPDPVFYDDTERYTRERLDKMASFYETTFAGIAFPGYDDILAILDAYVSDGAKTIDDAIEESQRILDTIRKERYLGQ